jgi:hypothetical protein
MVPPSHRFFDGNGDCRIAGGWVQLSQAALQGAMAPQTGNAAVFFASTSALETSTHCLFYFQHQGRDYKIRTHGTHGQGAKKATNLPHRRTRVPPVMPSKATLSLSPHVTRLCVCGQRNVVF